MVSNAKYAEIGQLLNGCRVRSSAVRPKLASSPAASLGITPSRRPAKRKHVAAQCGTRRRNDGSNCNQPRFPIPFLRSALRGRAGAAPG